MKWSVSQWLNNLLILNDVVWWCGGFGFWIFCKQALFEALALR
jgi:hypothetical protein